MSDPKRHHTVPQTYLKGFCEEDGRLTVWSKRRKKQSRPILKEALVRGYYYSQPVKGIERADHSMETKLLGGLETRYPELLQSLFSQEIAVDHELLLHTVLMLRARSTAFREAFELGLADFVDSLRRSMGETYFPPAPPNFPDIWENIVVTVDPHRSLGAMGYYIRHYTLPLARLEWSMKSTNGKIHLLTSDNPVIWYESGYGSNTPMIYGQEITSKTRAVLPISKSHALIGRKSGTGDFRYLGHAGELSINQVREINELQVACAWDEVVGKLSLPRAIFERLSALAPSLKIRYYEPESGAFLLTDTILEKIRKKHKFERDDQ